MENFTRPPCAQQGINTQHFPSSSYSSTIVNNTYNIPNYVNDFLLNSSQTVNRNIQSSSCMSTNIATFSNYSDQLDSSHWFVDPRAVADIERGLKLTDKIETIEITSKDLSPASCCSNMDMLIPDVYKNINKEFYYKSGNSEQQWYCNASCSGNQRHEYPCTQMNDTNYINVEEKNSKYDSCTVKYSSSTIENTQFLEHYEKNKCLAGNSYSLEKIHPSGQFFNTSLNQEQFYVQNSIACNNSLPFGNLVNLTQPVGTDCSNDGSDIIVEESDEEITDYSEDLERKIDCCMNCVVCNMLYTPLGSQFYVLNCDSPLTMSSQQSVYKKLVEIVGNLPNKLNYLCNQCLSLVNTIDHFEFKLQTVKTDLFKKFNKTCQGNKVNIPILSKFNKVKKRKRKKFRSFCGIHNFTCKLCKKLFSLKDVYKIHTANHKLKNRYLCEICGQRFSRSYNFEQHLKYHNKVEKAVKIYNVFQCKICEKDFQTKSKLQEHENYCSGSLPYACTYSNCDKKFPTITRFKNHFKLKHDQKFIAICSICNIGFVKMSDYKAHKITHSTEKKFNCTKCEKSYKTLSNLNYHLKFHKDKLPFICPICNKGFMRKEYLEAHINNHKGIKSFTCQFCDKKFVSQKNLDSHLKHHEGNVKKKLCNICNKSITTGFEDHMRIHSNLREFECKHCQMKFNTKGAFSKHIKRKHVNLQST